MGLIYVPERRIQRDFVPDYPVRVNSHHPLIPVVGVYVLPQSRYVYCRGDVKSLGAFNPGTGVVDSITTAGRARKGVGVSGNGEGFGSAIPAPVKGAKTAGVVMFMLDAYPSEETSLFGQVYITTIAPPYVGFSILSTGHIKWTHSGSGTTRSITSTNPVQLNTLYTVVGVNDPSELWINGVLDRTGIPNSYATGVSNISLVWLGRAISGSGETIQGSVLAGVLCSGDTAFSAAQIEQLQLPLNLLDTRRCPSWFPVSSGLPTLTALNVSNITSSGARHIVTST